MSVIHILKDGSRPTDITGHIVRLEDANPLYQLLHNINQTRSQVKKKQSQKMRQEKSFKGVLSL
jgi:hypothetical protein